MTPIQELLFELQDIKYADFQSNLTPTLSRERFIGVRTPELRALAKKLAAMRKIAESPNVVRASVGKADNRRTDGKYSDSISSDDIENFLKDLPHFYFEENQLHAFLIAEEKDFSACLAELERFLPYIDNWATCDQLSPGILKKEPEKLLPYIDRWLDSSHIYTVRFGIGMLMRYFLDDRFELKYAEQVAAVPSDRAYFRCKWQTTGDTEEPMAGDRPYYISMMVAWYFATALAKQYDAILPFLEENRLDNWTHNKTIQKAVESYRILPERKAYLKTLKRPSH
ncbi:MAG: DNA alkylation repair protein [Lachnospiraceae bacterium]|nr:DNA alkylation repair protein [Lachnospiraceae bacterium]